MLFSTDFEFPQQVSKYTGKVRDVYSIADEYLVLIATDRISAFDYILPKPIPYKGQVLNQLSAHFFAQVKDIMPVHVVATPDPNVTIGLRCKAYPIEVVVRGYLAGHAWRTYAAGGRELCGVKLPEGLRQNDRLPEPIITPATKSAIGHDEDISEKEILKSGLIDSDEWAEIRHFALQLFKRGTEMAAKQGLILVDTKYEFGSHGDRVHVIDEIHTPDSSRYFYADGYEARQDKGEAQQQLSKEFVREWLMENGFQGREGDVMPGMSDQFVQTVSSRYISLYEHITGKTFIKAPQDDFAHRIYDSVVPVLESIMEE